MRPIIIVSILLLGGITGESMATCDNSNWVNPTSNLSTLLLGNTVCGNEVGGGTDQWQEEHRSGSGGDLWERAKGLNDPVDPSHKVGIWTLDGTNGRPTVRYDYTGGNSYTFSVHSNGGGNYSFCDGSTEVATATIITSGGCGF
jgi:prepilin-type processing-associated H-X9-DG protein